jgi:site-specific recombinase XerD
MKTSVLELENLVQGFKLSCQTEGKSPKTIEWYIAFIGRFLGFLKRNEMPTDLEEVQKVHIRAFIQYLQTEAKTPFRGKPLSSATVQGYVRSLKAFFAWVIREEYLEVNPMSKIPVPKGTIKILNTFSREQIADMLEVCQKYNDTGYRNMTIILLLLDTGLRASELISISLDDINLEDGLIKIRLAKGNKERQVPVGSLVQKSLWKYINHYRPKPVTPEVRQLFLSDYGIPLSMNGLQQMVRRYGVHAGISGVRCSCHTFRHTFAKNYILNGGDIFSLQRILGHSSLASVRTYLNLFAADVKRQHQHFSPVNNFIKGGNMNGLIRQVGR